MTNSDFHVHVHRLFVKPAGVENKLLHAGIGIAGEAGEILDTLKKSWVYNQPLDAENLLEEAGDTLFYLVALLNLLNFTIDDAMKYNVDKLAKRYPNGYTDEHARARLDKDDQGGDRN